MVSLKNLSVVRAYASHTSRALARLCFAYVARRQIVVASLCDVANARKYARLGCLNGRCDYMRIGFVDGFGDEEKISGCSYVHEPVWGFGVFGVG